MNKVRLDVGPAGYTRSTMGTPSCVQHWKLKKTTTINIESLMLKEMISREYKQPKAKESSGTTELGHAVVLCRKVSL